MDRIALVVAQPCGNLALAVLLCVAGCAARPAATNPDAAGGGIERDVEDQQRVLQVLPAGSIVQLQPCRVRSSARTDGERAIGATVDGLLRESLRQSARLDFAAGIESVDPARCRFIVATTIDRDAGTIASSIIEHGTPDGAAAPLPLASTGFGARPLDQAIDTLASRIRIALGDSSPAADDGRSPNALPSAKIYSERMSCVESTEQALTDLGRGHADRAMPLLERARREDPGCTITLAAIANAELDLGRVKDAVRTANDTLRHLGARCAPTTSHRLARTLLLARAKLASSPREVRRQDELLGELGTAGCRERPYDPHPRLTRALAANYVGDFAASISDLLALRARWPDVGSVAYHLAFAQLATGDAQAAFDTMTSARGTLPEDVRLLPAALASFHIGATDALRVELERRLDAANSRASAARKAHELHRMLASLAILEGDDAAATRWLLADLDGLRHNASILPELYVDLTEAGEVLLELGAHRALITRLEALQSVASAASTRTPRVAQALTYLAGLALLATSEREPKTALATLDQARRTLWATLLRAQMHHARGEVVEEARELATAVRLSDAAWIRFRFARALRGLGRDDEARALLDETRERLLRINLRRPILHPLLSPGRAMAFVAARA